jgi:hypothetical protein
MMSKAKKYVKKWTKSAMSATGAAAALEGAGEVLAGEQPEDMMQVAAPVAPVADASETARRKERELARKYSTAGRAGTALSEGSKLG